MFRITPRIRIGIAIIISFTAVIMSPKQWVASPYIPTKEEILSLVHIPTFTISTLIKKDEISIQPTIEVEQVTSTPVVIPTNTLGTAMSPTPYIEIPTAAPTYVIVPTRKIIPTRIPTVAPTRIPPIRPTTVPSIRPSPTTTQSKTLNYSKLNAFVENPPQIGCKNNTISGCPVDMLYTTPLEKGLGWATYYGDEHKTGYNVVADVIHNNKGITIEAAHTFINENYMQTQSNMTPAEAKKTGKVIAFGATRTPKDLWKIKYAFGIDDSKNPQARFIGRIMIIDCAATNDWKNNLATLSYSYKGWSALNWIVDLSKNGFIQLPTGYSGRADNVGEGRPGVILVDEASLDGLIY